MGVPLSYLFAAILGRGEKEIFRGRTDYYEARVVDDEAEGTRHLFLDIQLASGMHLPDGALLFKYTFMARLAYLTLPTESTRRALFIGMGGGTEVRHFLLSRPDAKVDVVEPDTKLPPIARSYFRFPPEDKRINIHAVDGYKYLSAIPPTRKYDFIRLDAFEYSTTIPGHLISPNSAQLMRNHLSPNGILAANIVSPLTGEGSGPFYSIYAAFASAFPHITVLATRTPTPEKQQNIAILASIKRPVTRSLLEKTAGMDAKLSEIARDCIWAEGQLPQIGF